jgi:hypothetical protein
MPTVPQDLSKSPVIRAPGPLRAPNAAFYKRQKAGDRVAASLIAIIRSLPLAAGCAPMTSGQIPDDARRKALT